MTIEKKETILEKINKLLAQTEDRGCTKGEANTAFEMARKLMLKYKIEENELNKDKTDKDIEKVEIKMNFTIKWYNHLISVLAKNFGILYYYNNYGKKNRTCMLYGFKNDINCVKDLFEHMVNFADYNASKYATNYRRDNGSAKGIKNAYFVGFINGIEDKYEKQNQENQEWGLILTNQVEEVIKPQYDKMTSDPNKFKSIKMNNTIRYNPDVIAKNKGYNDGLNFGSTKIEAGIL